MYIYIHIYINMTVNCFTVFLRKLNKIENFEQIKDLWKMENKLCIQLKMIIHLNFLITYMQCHTQNTGCYLSRMLKKSQLKQYKALHPFFKSFIWNKSSKRPWTRILQSFSHRTPQFETFFPLTYTKWKVAKQTIGLLGLSYHNCFFFLL